MKKFIVTLVFLFSFISFDTILDSNAERIPETNDSEKLFQQKMAQLEEEMYIKNLVQYIEFESEVIIPDRLDGKYIKFAFNLADSLELPTRTVFRLMYKESLFNDTIVSPVGAEGLMQLMPETRNMYYDLLRVDTLNYDKNQEDIYIGLNLLNDLYNFWVSRGNSVNYSWKLALASYNAGRGAVLKHKGIPPYKETTDFVTFISKAHSNPRFFANYAQKYENQIKRRS